MATSFRVGLVGAGYVSTHHAQALKDIPFVDLVGVVDQNPVQAARLSSRFGIPVYSSLVELASAGANVIHVLTPPASHCALTLEALHLGCHVFVEKPMAETAAECDQMMEAARRSGRVLSVNHSARFDPGVLRAAELIRQGACGDVTAVHFLRSSEYPPYAGGPLPAPYRQGSYPFRDLGVHAFYLLEMLLGPARDLLVRAYESKRNPLLTFDEWRADSEHERGTGHMYLSWNTRPIQNELVIHGTRGRIQVDCLLQTCEFSGTMPGPKQIGMIVSGTRNALHKSFQIPWTLVRFATGKLRASPGIYRSVRDFYSALQEGRAAPVSPEEGRSAVAWIERVTADIDREKTDRLARAAAPELPSARVLVTGASGFVGGLLVEKLRERGESVRLLLRRPPTRGSPADSEVPGGGRLSYVYGSLGQPEIVDAAARGVEIVYHVGAAMKGPREEFEQGTVWGTKNIVEACLRHGVKRLVYVSSLGILDHAGHPHGIPVTEQSAFEPFPERRGTYTNTKLEAERLVLHAAQERGLPAVIIRPGQIFGPGAEGVSPNGVIGIAGQWIVAGAGTRKLPLVYRDDVVDGLLLAAQAEHAAGEVVHLVDTTPVDQNEYLRAWRQKIKDKPVRRVPVFVLMAAAWMIELLGKALKREVPLTRYRVRSLRPLYPFDTSKAQRVLGWRPRVGVQEGLRRTFGAGHEAAKND